MPNDPIINEPSKSYLGDGVYAAVDQGMVKLTAENGIIATDTIYLEPQVYTKLVEWFQRITAQPTHDPNSTPQ